MQKEEISLKLRNCNDKIEIENLFEHYKIKSASDKIELLNMSMYNPQIFYNSENISEEDRLDLTLDLFLMKDWKLNELYEKAGF